MEGVMHDRHVRTGSQLWLSALAHDTRHACWRAVDLVEHGCSSKPGQAEPESGLSCTAGTCVKVDPATPQTPLSQSRVQGFMQPPWAAPRPPSPWPRLPPASSRGPLLHVHVLGPPRQGLAHERVTEHVCPRPPLSYRMISAYLAKPKFLHK